MSTDESLLEIRSYTGDGYMPLVDYENWRVAILKFEEGLLPEAITDMQRHDETDEVFVLLAGRCILLLGEGSAAVTAIHAEDMEPLKIYNVKKGVWHHHALSEDAVVLIVENRDTVDANSPKVALKPGQTQRIVEQCQQLWAGG